MASHLDVRSGAALAIGGTLAAVALGLVTCESVPNLRDQEASARAMVSHTPSPSEAWPPQAGDLDTELYATALERAAKVAAERREAEGVQADAGPPIQLPSSSISGVQVRQDVWENIHFLEVVIGEASFEDPLPTAFVFHGRGGQAQLPGGPFLGLSSPIRVIVPQAPDRLGQGWEWLPVSIGSGLVDRLASSLFHVSSRMAEMIRVLTVTRATLGKPIVMGFSQGGLITYALALHHDDVVGHAFPLSTWLPPSLEPFYKRSDLQYPPIRSMHGLRDPVIPAGPTQELVQRLRSRGFDVELVEFPSVGHEMSAEMNELFHRWLEEALCQVRTGLPCPAPPSEADGGVELADGSVLDGTVVEGASPDPQRPD